MIIDIIVILTFYLRIGTPFVIVQKLYIPLNKLYIIDEPIK